MLDSDPQTITIKPFEPKDQDRVKTLIQEGLGEHWGRIDPTLNPDLNDIRASYARATFLVAWHGDRIAGTGALIPQSDEVGEIVRMSVATDMRRHGIGRMVLARLIEDAKQRGLRRIVLETTATWHNVIQFYQRCGFQITHYEESEFGQEAHFKLDINP